MLKPLACLAIPMLLCRCAFPGAEETIDPNPYQLLEEQAGPENRDRSKVNVPMLKAPDLAKRWGAPKFLTGFNGAYALRYENPKDKTQTLTIYGTSKKYPVAGPVPPRYTDVGHDEEAGTFEPKEVNPVWYFSKIDGKIVRYAVVEEGATDDPWELATETFRHTAADGREASYRIFVSLPGKAPHLEAGEFLELVTY